MRLSGLEAGSAFVQNALQRLQTGHEGVTALALVPRCPSELPVGGWFRTSEGASNGKEFWHGGTLFNLPANRASLSLIILY
jgi:hypothetical protein